MTDFIIYKTDNPRISLSTDNKKRMFCIDIVTGHAETFLSGRTM